MGFMSVFMSPEHARIVKKIYPARIVKKTKPQQTVLYREPGLKGVYRNPAGLYIEPGREPGPEGFYRNPDGGWTARKPRKEMNSGNRNSSRMAHSKS